MSWGVDIEVDHGDGYITRVEVVDGHTYNLTPMWEKSGVIEASTSEFEGQITAHLAPSLLAALADAWTREREFRELDPPNGWGDYEDFVEILTRFARLCHQHPTGIVRWNG